MLSDWESEQLSWVSLCLFTSGYTHNIHIHIWIEYQIKMGIINKYVFKAK